VTQLAVLPAGDFPRVAHCPAALRAAAPPGPRGGGCRRAGERGSITVELAGLAPALLLILLLLIAAMRVTVAGGRVDSAARDAARAASLTRTPGQASLAAGQTAARSLAGAHVACTRLAVTVDTAGFTAPSGAVGTVGAGGNGGTGGTGGTGGAVGVHISCAVDLADVAIPGVPGSMTMTASYTAPLDPYRAR